MTDTLKPEQRKRVAEVVKPEITWCIDRGGPSGPFLRARLYGPWNPACDDSEWKALVTWLAKKDQQSGYAWSEVIIDAMSNGDTDHLEAMAYEILRRKMTDFTPEHYLAAARIAYPADRLSLQPNPIDAEYFVLREVWRNYRWEERGYFNPRKADDYRALREALDKEYGIAIYWWGDAWLSEPNLDRDYGIPCMDDDDITRLMMKNVVALVEAGVVE